LCPPERSRRAPEASSGSSLSTPGGLQGDRGAVQPLAVTGQPRRLEIGLKCRAIAGARRSPAAGARSEAAVAARASSPTASGGRCRSRVRSGDPRRARGATAERSEFGRRARLREPPGPAGPRASPKIPARSAPHPRSLPRERASPRPAPREDRQLHPPAAPAGIATQYRQANHAVPQASFARTDIDGYSFSVFSSQFSVEKPGAKTEQLKTDI